MTKKTKNKIAALSDEECLTKFIEFLEERVSITTGFVKDPVKDIYTHQIVEVRCGEYSSTSQPEPLDSPLRLATAEEQGVTIN